MDYYVHIQEINKNKRQNILKSEQTRSIYLLFYVLILVHDFKKYKHQK